MYATTGPYKRKDGSQARRHMCANVRSSTGLCDQPKVDAELALMGSSVQRGFHDEPDRGVAGSEDRQGIGSPRLGIEAAMSG